MTVYDSASGAGTDVASEGHYSILPSYQMHQAILAKPSPTFVFDPLPRYSRLASPDDHLYDNTDDLPFYNTTCANSQESLVDPCCASSCSGDSCFSAAAHGPSEESSLCRLSRDPSQMNLHSKYNLLYYNNYKLAASDKMTSQTVALSIHLTSEAGTSGKTPKLISPESSNYYTTGDCIYGYVTFENLTATDLTFGMFHVLLEGNIHQSDSTYKFSKHPECKTTNFLQSVDLSASYNYSSIQEGSMYDQSDNTCLSFNEGRVLVPGVKYKRYFSFKVPSKVLDYCGKQDIAMQTDLPPSSDVGFLETKSFNECRVEYSIVAKFYGEESNIYTPLKDCIENVTIIPKTSNALASASYRGEIKELTSSIKANAEHYIKLGKQIRKLIPNENYHGYKKGQEFVESRGPNETSGQVSAAIHRKNLPFLTKKALLGSTIESGLLEVSIPTSNHEVKYIPPVNFRKSEILRDDLDTWKISVPVTLDYVPYSSTKLPEITNVSASLECITYMYDKFKLPIEIDFDYLFNNDTGEELPGLLKKTFKNLEYDLCEQIREINNSQHFGVEAALLQDLGAISTMKTKKTTLEIPSVTLSNSKKLSSSGVAWSSSITKDLSQSSNATVGQNGSKYQPKHKEITITVDVSSAVLKSSLTGNAEWRSFDNYSLIPSFQNCYTGRMYCLKLTLELLHGAMTTTRIPITITN